MGFIGNVINDFRRTNLTRKRMQAEDRVSSLAVNEAQGFRLPISYGNDTFLLSDKAAWTGFNIPAKTWGFLDQEATKSYFLSANQVFSGIFPADKENQGHILVTNQVYSPDDWEQALINRHKAGATSSFAPIIRATRQAITAREFFERETYMFVRLGDRGQHEGIRGWLQRGMEYMMLGSGLEDTQPDLTEIEKWSDQADTAADALSSSWLNALPINRRRVEWLVRHIDSPGLPTPETIESADGEPWGIGWWRTVLASYTRRVDLGRVGRTRYKAIEFDSPMGDGTTYAAFLPVSYIPTKLAYNVNWLHHASSLPFPVDASVRFEIIDPDRAMRMIQRPINAAEGQAEEDAEAGVRQDETTQLQQEELRGVKTQVKMGRQPIARWQAVFCVYDTSKEELRSKITQLIKHYKDIEFDLVNPPHDQRELFYQSFPGGEIEVEDWVHKTSTYYLASAQPWLTSAVGDKDGSGLYQGYTILRDAKGRGKKGSPVFYDLLNVVDEEGRAPTEACAAESGSGKTVSRGLKSAYEDFHRGVTQFIWDPKGDFLSLVNHAEWMRLDRSKIKLINLQDPKTSVSLDPFGIAEVDVTDPSNVLDDRESSAVDVLKTLLKKQIASDKSNIGEWLLRQAVRRELEKEKGVPLDQVVQLRNDASDRALEQEPCLQGVMATLDEWGQENSDIPIQGDRQNDARFMTKVMLDTLHTMASSTLGKLLFRRPSQSGALNVEQGDLVLFCAINMATTEPGEEPTEKTILPDIISGMMTDYIRSFLYILPDHYTKCATFDEWHVIKRSARADALVKWMRRMGRSKRCMVRQMSQSAGDFYDPNDPQSSRTSLATVWCGKVDSTDEGEASCVLLGIEPSKHNIDTLKNLGKGQFLFRDSFGRVAFVQVEIFDDGLLDRFNTDAASKDAAIQQTSSEEVLSASH